MNETTPQQQPVINSMETTAYKELLLSEAEAKLKRVKLYIILIGAVQLIVGLVLYFTDEINGATSLILQGIVAFMFFGLALLVNKKPRIAVIAAFILYAVLVILNSIADPESIIKGILIKGIILYSFFMGIKAAREAEELRLKLGLLKLKEDEMPLDMVK